MDSLESSIESSGVASAECDLAVGVDTEWDARIEALVQLARTDPVSALERAQAALGELRGSQRLDLESRLTWLVGYSHELVGTSVEAAVQLHRAIGMAQASKRGDLEAHYLGTLGFVHARMFAFSEAIDCYERALSLHQSLPPSNVTDLLRAKILGNLAAVFQFMGRPDKAASHYLAAREHALRVGDLHLAANLLDNCAEAHVVRAQQLSQQSSKEAPFEAAAAAGAARALAAEVVANSALKTEDRSRLNAQLVVVTADTILGNWATALDELNQIAPHLDAHGSLFRAKRCSLRARLLRLTGRAAEATAELQAEPVDDLSAPDHIQILEELIAAQEAAGDLSGALASFRRYHELTLQARDQSAEQRGQVLNARLELERAQHKAEIERLRAEQLTLRNEELARQAHMDALTGLPNRRGLDAALAHRIGEERAQFACVLADIDHFKRINDRYSHLVGDEVLRRVGALVREVVRDGDVAARYGGEEFALLLDRVDGRQAVEVSERLRQVIAAQPWEQIVGGLAVTISLGVAMRRAGDSAEALLGRADGCLYAAKAAGRDRVVAEAAELAADSAPDSASPVAR
jgi:diguanylate cyclase (GGDEF)-like protein